GGLESVLARLQIKQEANAPPGRLLALLAASGGSGSSTLAVNMAVVLAKEQQRCALLDLKPGIGDLAALLDLKPQFNLADLCLNVARLDRAMFEKMLAKHSSGVQLLASPQVFGKARGEKLAHFIPDDPKTFNRANNAGIPVVLNNPTAKVSRSIVELTHLALTQGNEEPAPGVNGAALTVASASS